MSDTMDEIEDDQPRASERNQRIGRERARNMAALGAILDHYDTRGWVWSLLDRCHVFGSSFAANPHVTAFREGERNIGLQVFSDIQREFPEQYALMAKEAHERHKHRAP